MGEPSRPPRMAVGGKVTPNCQRDFGRAHLHCGTISYTPLILQHLFKISSNPICPPPQNSPGEFTNFADVGNFP
jgi:hypothetical protein